MSDITPTDDLPDDASSTDAASADDLPEGGPPAGDPDYDDVLARLQQRWEREEQEAKATLKTLCGQLREQGVEQVRIAYDGCGDSGVIDGVTATGKDGEEAELDDPLLETLTDAAYQLLPGGWEINEGSFGELVLDVPAMRLVREHSWRVESTEYDEQEIEL